MNANDDTDATCGLDIELSQTEIQYLESAGVAPHLLRGVDRAAIIQALMAGEDAEGPLALIYKFGILRAMLLHHEAKDREKAESETKKEKEEERLKQEFNRYMLLGPAAYVAANPLPPRRIPVAPGGSAIALLEQALAGYNRLPHRIALIPETMEDSDPTHLRPPVDENKPLAREPLPERRTERIQNERDEEERPKTLYP